MSEQRDPLDPLTRDERARLAVVFAAYERGLDLDDAQRIADYVVDVEADAQPGPVFDEVAEPQYAATLAATSALPVAEPATRQVPVDLTGLDVIRVKRPGT